MTAMLEIQGQPCALGALLGSGGMGRVYEVRHPSRARLVVKLLHEVLADDPRMVSRFEAEARAAHLVMHRNVVRILGGGATPDGKPFVVMEHARGGSLGALIRREGPLPLARIRSIASQILGGLAAIHRAGLVHGDMKSDNVLVDATAGGDHVTIIDFGLARPPASNASSLGAREVSGTPAYMAPEQILGEPLTAQTDLYAVGVILYEMLTGTTPCGGGTTATGFARHLADEVVPPSLQRADRPIPVALEHAVLRALEMEPAARHLDASMFAAEVERSVPVDHVEPALPHRVAVFSTSAPTYDWIRPHAPPPRPHRLSEAGVDLV